MTYRGCLSRSRRLQISMAAIAVVAAGSACAPLEKFYVGENGDRPAITVGSSSVTLMAEPDPNFHYRGFFAEHLGSRWLHQHPNAATVALEVTVTGASACTSTVRTSELEVGFDVAGEHKSLTIDIDRGDLRVDSHGTAFVRDRVEPYVLKNEAARLMSVEIEGQGECTFDASTRAIHIAQRRQ